MRNRARRTASEFDVLPQRVLRLRAGYRVGTKWLERLPTELVEFCLHVLDHLALEELALLEDFFHSHSGDNDASFPLNDALTGRLMSGVSWQCLRVYTFDNVLDMTATCSSLAFRVGFVSAREDLGVLSQGVRSVVWSNGEYSR